MFKQTRGVQNTDLHAVQAPVQSVNVAEGPSVHRAGSRHLQSPRQKINAVFVLRLVRSVWFPRGDTSAHVRRHRRQKTWQQLSGTASSPAGGTPRQMGHLSASSPSVPSDGPWPPKTGRQPLHIGKTAAGSICARVGGLTASGSGHVQSSALRINCGKEERRKERKGWGLAETNHRVDGAWTAGRETAQ